MYQNFQPTEFANVLNFSAIFSESIEVQHENVLFQIIFKVIDLSFICYSWPHSIPKATKWVKKRQPSSLSKNLSLEMKFGRWILVLVGKNTFLTNFMVQILKNARKSKKMSIFEKCTFVRMKIFQDLTWRFYRGIYSSRIRKGGG